jgi:glycerol-3-phosphate acyltransferase PlsY
MFETLPLAARLPVCFLLGSIPFAVIAMRGTGIDILRAGSGNPGFNNVLRYHKGRAVMTLFGDVAKGMLAVLLFHRSGDPLAIAWLYGIAAVLGHCYSPFLKFHGGKGVATAAGVMVVLYPALALACVAVFLAARLTGCRRKWLEAGTIASVSTSFLFATLVAALRSPQEALLAAAMAAFIAFRHKKNFGNLVHAWRAQRDRPLAASEER